MAKIIPLGCQFCQISYNVAQRYKVIKCNKSDNFLHNFVDLIKLVQKK